MKNQLFNDMVAKLSSLLVVVLICSTIDLYAQEPVCNDTVCMIEAHGGTMPAGEIFSVVCPLGKSVVRPIEQAPRLPTLDGKTIALVGGSFMASVTHLEIKRLILKEYPTAKVHVLSEIGAAGVFPGPGIRRKSVEQFQSRLKELGVDASSAVTAVADCVPRKRRDRASPRNTQAFLQ